MALNHRQSVMQTVPKRCPGSVHFPRGEGIFGAASLVAIKYEVVLGAGDEDVVVGVVGGTAKERLAGWALGPRFPRVVSQVEYQKLERIGTLSLFGEVVAHEQHRPISTVVGNRRHVTDRNPLAVGRLEIAPAIRGGIVNERAHARCSLEGRHQDYAQLGIVANVRILTGLTGMRRAFPPLLGLGVEDHRL